MTSDDELLQQWQSGDANAGNALLLRYFVPIRRFFANKVPPADVEDLVQRSFMGCVEARGRMRSESSVRAFLFGIAKRQLYKFLRDRNVRARHVDIDFSVSSVRDLGHSPASMMAEQEDHELLLQALQRVSVEHQTILELFYWEQLSGREIAEALGIPHATVRTRLHRGREALERAFVALAGMERADRLDLEHAMRQVGQGG